MMRDSVERPAGQYAAVGEMLTGRRTMSCPGGFTIWARASAAAGRAGSSNLADTADRRCGPIPAAPSGGPARMNKWRS